MNDPFSQVHPLNNFLYFLLVIGISMFSLHPYILAISFLGAVSYSLLLEGIKKVLLLQLKFIIPGMLVVIVVNPAFNHYGVTQLYRMQNGNAITLEAIVIGFALALVFANTINWFTCYNQVMTSDKFIYLFGKIIPASSLILSMAFRFVPKFSQQLTVVRNGQKSIGRDFSNGKFIYKIRQAFRIFSIMVTWALENAIKTADSMKARGYGLKGRTAFSLYRFDLRDGVILAYLLISSVGCFLSFAKQALYVSYNPQIMIKGWPLNWQSGIGLVSFFFLVSLPIFIRCWDTYKWFRIKVDQRAVLPKYFDQISQKE
ncbi:energy-coupling factor transporter transmembrane component T [Enterococcus xiangfangensis]|uniref:Energy-coupling factor transporter transmembrane component T n=1 Tax=Enterococcus xiangfangensis TaxID=1296537 RepID=A0ABU3F9K2_9ENTE|nr:energy-coupling factor transporter transmembrane component T [Enterococcus xiangfangensis]MDT2759344.1 energy-coupling factor transporter transmembrane component T [Enterococcus xiangfangensis]